MGILDAIQTGLSELLSHKMRSMLTMLGVIFGVAAVIAMVSIGERWLKNVALAFWSLGLAASATANETPFSCMNVRARSNKAKAACPSLR